MSAFRFAARRVSSAAAVPSSQRTVSRAVARPAASSMLLPRQRWYSAEAKQDKSAEAKSDESQTSSSSSSTKELEEQHAKAIGQKDTEISSLKDALVHKLADFENLQKTTDREVAKAKEFALSKFAEDLVKSVDVLELAIGSVSASANAKKEANPTEDAERIRADFDSLLQGVQMTASNLEKTLARYGVTKFDPVGEKFDPNKHEALFMVPLAAAGPDAKESGVVMNTQKTGWMYNSRVLRAAQVGVTQ